jgi:hypothetical protein
MMNIKRQLKKNAFIKRPLSIIAANTIAVNVLVLNV